MILNRELLRFDQRGHLKWQDKIISPNDSYILQSRVHGSGRDAYVSGYTKDGDFFVTKLNRLNRQVILWDDRGANIEEPNLPAITGYEDEIFHRGSSRSNDFPGTQFDLTSKSQAFVMKYAPPDYVVNREPVELCGVDATIRLPANVIGCSINGTAMRSDSE